MNTYFKLEANIFLAKCETPYNKGDIIEMTTQRGKTHERIRRKSQAKGGILGELRK